MDSVRKINAVLPILRDFGVVPSSGVDDYVEEYNAQPNAAIVSMSGFGDAVSLLLKELYGNGGISADLLRDIRTACGDAGFLAEIKTGFGDDFVLIVVK